MQRGDLGRTQTARLWSTILAIIYTMEQVLEADDARTTERVREIVGGARKPYTPTPYSPGTGRRDRSPYDRSRGSSPGAYNRVDADMVAAVLKVFQAGTEPRRYSGKKDARDPPGPLGSNAPPYSKTHIRSGTASPRPPRRGPPSAQNTCNYCASAEHFWRSCPKREADEKAPPTKATAARMAACWARELDQEEAHQHGGGSESPRGGSDTSDSRGDDAPAHSDSGMDSSGGESGEFDSDGP